MSRLRFACALTAFAVCLSTPLQSSSAPREDAEVSLAELKLRVCDADYAGTNSLIHASLKPGTTSTALDYPRNDFQRDTEFTYVLSLADVRTFADIQTLSIMNWGTDQVCFDRIQLIVNRSLIFERLGEVRIDSSFVSIGYSELRSHPLWSNWHHELGGYFNAEMLRRIVAAGVATGMAENAAGDYSYSWYGTNNPVITPRDKDSFNVRIELEFRQKCLIPMTETYTYCRLFVLSGDFVLGVTCIQEGPIAYHDARGYIQVRGVPIAELQSGMSRFVYNQLWRTDMQRDMERIVDTTAKAFGRQPNCKVFQL